MSDGSLMMWSISRQIQYVLGVHPVLRGVVGALGAVCECTCLDMHLSLGVSCRRFGHDVSSCVPRPWGSLNMCQGHAYGVSVAYGFDSYVG